MVLFAALAGVVFLMYQAWQEDYPSTAQAGNTSAPLASSDLPPPPAGEDESVLNDSDVPSLGASSKPVQQLEAVADSAVQNAAGDIWIETDVYRIRLNLAGGDLRRLELLQYPVTKDQPDQALALLNDELPHFFVIQSGLVDAQGQAPDHRAVYTSERSRYALTEGADDLIVPLRWEGPDGLSVDKIYRFKRGSYEVELLYRVNNATDTARQLSPYLRMWRTPHKAGGEPPFIQSFIGAALYTRDGDQYKFKKHSADDLADTPVSVEQQGGWVGMLQHYFVAAILPAASEQNRFNLRPGKRYGFIAEYVGEQAELAEQAGREINLKLYLGPKMQQQLEEVAKGLELTVDYGLLTPISQPLFWVLDKLHGFTGNWGWSIILLTLLIKLAFYKLSEAQYRSMGRMKKFAPRIQAIKERYADDRERLHQAMMDLYKKEGFNPLAGCWPMLVQFPVFIALYWVLLESVELRQADFMLWLNDLSSPDPLYVLPVLFGLSMFLQQKLSGQTMTMEPMQQRIMNIMPIGLSIFFAFFPAGLVLYWFVSNVIGIAQQFVINKRLESEDQAQTQKR